MRQGHGGEGRQGVGAVQGVIDPLAAPPPGGDWSERRRERKVRSLILEVAKGAKPGENSQGSYNSDPVGRFSSGRGRLFRN